ncbi:MAG: YybS family protein [Synergistaceae bacterium]|nr:YybS family protein [Synergistaceae bacterium]
MTRTKALVESSLLVALAVVLFLASNTIPIVGIAFTFLCPAPLVVLGLRHSLGRAALGSVVATLIVSIFLGFVGGLFFLFGFAVLGVALGALGKKRENAVEIALYGILVSLASKLVLMVLLTRLTGVNPFSLDTAEFDTILERVMSLYSKTGLIPKESLSAMRQQFEATFRFIPQVFPALLTIAASIDSVLSYAVSRTVLMRLGRGVLPPLPPFGEWRFPRNIFWALLASAILPFLGGSGHWGDLLQRVGVNLRLLVSLLFLVQGVSVAWALLGRTRFSSRIARGLIIFVAILVPIFSYLLMIVGLVDIWWDLRARLWR